MHVYSAVRTAPNSELCDAGSEHCVPLSVPLCVNLMGRACSAFSPAGLLLLKWNEIFCDLIWFKYIFCLGHFVNYASLHCGFCSWCSVWTMAIDQLFIKTHKQLVFRWKSIIRYKYCSLCNYGSFTSDIFEEIRRNLAIKRTSESLLQLSAVTQWCCCAWNWVIPIEWGHCIVASQCFGFGVFPWFTFFF